MNRWRRGQGVRWAAVQTPRPGASAGPRSGTAGSARVPMLLRGEPPFAAGLHLPGSEVQLDSQADAAVPQTGCKPPEHSNVLNYGAWHKINRNPFQSKLCNVQLGFIFSSMRFSKGALTSVVS